MNTIPRMTEDQLQEIFGRCPHFIRPWIEAGECPSDIEPMLWWRQFGLKTRFAVALVHLEATVRHLQNQLNEVESTQRTESENR